MDVRDLIITDDLLNTNSAEQTTTTRKRKAPQPPTWEVVLKDACDGAVRRKTAKTSRLLVILMSQGQFYIKDEKTGEIEDLDELNLHKFMAGCTDSIIPLNWCGEFTSRKKDAANFVRYIHDENFQWLVKRDLVKINYNNSYWRNPSFYELQKLRNKHDNPLNKSIRAIVSDIFGEEITTELENERYYVDDMARQKAHDALCNVYDDELKAFQDKFGIDLTRIFIREFITAPYTGTDMPYMGDSTSGIFGICDFEPHRFMEYLLHDSVRQGYATSSARYSYGALRTFFDEWKDTLEMQKRLRGKVYDKYPDDLSSMHRKLAFKCVLMKQYIDERAFREHSERLAQHMKQDEHFIIRPPYNKQDIIDEATMQANCLATYIDVYANDRTDLYFMRDVLEPDKSLVTVEIRDGKVRQAYAACNATPNKECVKWLTEWAEENGFEMIDVDKQRPLVA